jgi:hypothetical protein
MYCLMFLCMVLGGFLVCFGCLLGSFVVVLGVRLIRFAHAFTHVFGQVCRRGRWAIRHAERSVGLPCRSVVGYTWNVGKEADTNR